MDAGETPGYCILESAGSRRRQIFVVGNGHKVPNQGEVHLNLDATVGNKTNKIRSVFQVAAITRPLMSVSKICDQGLVALFDKDKAQVKNEAGDTVCEFVRKGGLYVCEMRLRRPDTAKEENESTTPFGRQGR